MNKRQLARFLKDNGYFWQYKTVDDIVEHFKLDDLKVYYKEYRMNRGYKQEN